MTDIFYPENERYPDSYALPAEVVTSNTLNDLSNRFDEELLAQGIDYNDISAPASTVDRRSFHSRLRL